ncbi:MAG: helix-turn-helix transcriptional regulator [Tissierellia bacterium]|nr:helix-turn-helix transcriptional regulator [Tissierellia bacterium]
MSKFTSGFEIIHEFIGLKWVPEILESIGNGNKRYTDILNSIPYLSHTELQRKLKILQEKNAISKKDTNTGPEYQLEAFGKDLLHIFVHFSELSEKYLMTS